MNALAARYLLLLLAVTVSTLLPGAKSLAADKTPAKQETKAKQADGKAKGKFTPLFDGRSFAGWEGDTEKVWRIEDGAIVAGSLETPAPRNEFLTTTETYQNFDLRLKYKIIGDDTVNAGVQFRTKRIPDHYEVNGYQADIGPTTDGHLYDESRRKRMLATPDPEVLEQARAAVDPSGWNSYRIRAVGDRIQIWLNGVKTVDYVEQEEGIDDSGVIAVQIHGKMRAVVAYKDLEIRELPEDAGKKGNTAAKNKQNAADGK